MGKKANLKLFTILILLLITDIKISADTDTVSIAVFDGASPVVYTDSSGNPSGFFPDILSHIFSENNIKIEFIQGLSFQEATAKVLKGEIDILPAVKYSPERKEYFDFNSESFIISWSQVFAAPGSSIKNIFDLRDKKVALLKDGQNGRNFVKLMNDFDIPFVSVFYNNLDEMSDSLFRNNVDAMVSFNFYIKTNPEIEATEIIFSPTRALVAVKKGTSGDILELIDRDLVKLKDNDNSIYYKLLDKWFLAETHDIIPMWVYILLAIAAASVALTVLFIIILKIQVGRTAEQLSNSEEVYKTLFNVANDSIFLLKIRSGESGIFTDVNRNACERFGYTRAEFLGMSPYDLISEELKRQIPLNKEKLLQNGHAIFQSVYMTKGKNKIPVEINSQMFEMNGENYVMSVVRDISYREEFDNLLSAVEMKYRTIADYNYDWEFWQTPERNYIYLSPSCLRISGYEADEYLNDSTLFSRIVYHEDSDVWDTYCKKCEDISESHSSFEFRIIRKDGNIIWIEQQCRKLYDSDGRFLGYRGSIRDIDKRKSMEHQLKRKQKLESIGVLAGGIAHDFNNILAIIRGYAELGQIDESAAVETREKFSTILQAANRGVNLTGQILDFARDKRSGTKAVNVSAIAGEIYNLIKPSFPGTIKINLDIKTDAYVLADEGQFHQMFMNICTNARLAMPEGGELSICVRETKSAEDSGIFPESPGVDLIEISFKDTGVGMSEEVRDKIFDPFFTTRETGKGSGMGMSVVHGLVMQWGGRIIVESSPGEGTLILIYFKRYNGSADETEKDIIFKKTDKLYKIIVFDDEEMILDLIEKFLTREGHSVIRYSDPLKGLEYFKKNFSELDLVITDMTMPDLSGDSLALDVKNIRNDIPVLLSSGYSDRLADKSMPEGVDALLKKPFTGNELTEAVNNLLDNS